MIQEIALLGLWRAKFFEKAAFYGGTALRILYGLPRFSEDLDFSLLAPDKSFDMTKYERELIKELGAFGFEVEVVKKNKSKESTIESAFIKANTMTHLLMIRSNFKTYRDATLNIKLEIDKDPPAGFSTEAIPVFWPIAYSVKTFTLENLFAGKLHACLCRSERINIKGRDWHDFLWYITRDVPLNLPHLQKRMEQTGHWHSSKRLWLADVIRFIKSKIGSIDLERARRDVRPFIKDPRNLDAWSAHLFGAAADRLRASNAV